jgi:hypothetical protein
MKKGKGKKKFVDIDEACVVKPNVKSAIEYETPLQTLEKNFPDLDYEIIETIYEDCGRNVFLAQKKLEQMTIVEEKVEMEGSELDHVPPNEQKYEDINSFVKFRYDDPFIDDGDKETGRANHGTDMKKKMFMVSPENVNQILSQQKKNSDAYESVFLIDNPVSGVCTNNGTISEDYLEEVILDYYIDILVEFFPKHPRQQLMEKLCEFDFDIDRLILQLLDINDTDLNELDTTEISTGFKEELVSNMYLRDEKEFDTIKTHNIQSVIEKEIKRNNVLKKVCNGGGIYNESEFPFLSEDIKEDVLNSQKASDEYFLDKEIKDIKSRQIREDLLKLVKNFPMLDEFEIKWVYFNFLDYHLTYKYLTNSAKSIHKKNLFDSKEIEKSKNKFI